MFKPKAAGRMEDAGQIAGTEDTNIIFLLVCEMTLGWGRRLRGVKVVP